MTNASRGAAPVGWTVPDLAAATSFLTQAFGAEILRDSLLQTDTLPAGPATELPPTRLLRLATGALLELVEVGHALPQRLPGLADFGYTHIVLHVDDMSAAVLRFEAAGGQLLAPPHPLGEAESGSEALFVYGRTPWGALVELLSQPVSVQYPSLEVAGWTPAAAA